MIIHHTRGKVEIKFFYPTLRFPENQNKHVE